MELVPSRTSMKITDLNFDCLQSCLRHLNIEELLNVADSNTELKHVARYVFGRMYREESVCIRGILRLRSENYGCQCERFRLFPKDYISIHDLKLCLQFLRCFGDLVSMMGFDFYYKDDNSLSSKNCQFFLDHTIQCPVRSHELELIIIEYINEFCADSLTSLYLNKRFIENINCDLDKLDMKPFKNVIFLSGNIFFKTELKLHELFPKVRQIATKCSDNGLITKDTSLPNYSMANGFPYLEDLWICIDHGYKYNKENFAIALRLSSQIKFLKGNVWFEVLFDVNNFRFWNGNEHLQNLEKLELDMDFRKNPHLNEILKKPFGDDFHLKNLKELIINIRSGWNHDADNIFNFPFTGDNLESLHISSNGCRFKRFWNLLDKHPTVKKFHIQHNKDKYTPTLDTDDCTKITMAFPILEEISFETTHENVIKTIEAFPLLKYFKCYVRYIENFAESDIRSINGWLVFSRMVNEFCDIILLLEGIRKNWKI